MDESARLREKLDELKEVNRQLKDELGLIDQLPDVRKLRLLGVSGSCFTIFSLLERRSIVTSDAIISALWGYDSPENTKASIGVYLNRLRKVLSRYDIKITNVWGVGWCFDDDSRARAAELMKEMTQ